MVGCSGLTSIVCRTPCVSATLLLSRRYPEGESYLDLVQRLWPVVHHLEQRQSPVVVVAHQVRRSC
jgi:hypothetical protein